MSHTIVSSIQPFLCPTEIAKNEIFIVGTLNNLQFGALSKINTTSFEELMYSIYTSDDDEIYLVINSGEIFKSIEKDENLSFAPHNVISENIRKICTGNGFVSIVTGKRGPLNGVCVYFEVVLDVICVRRKGEKACEWIAICRLRK